MIDMNAKTECLKIFSSVICSLMIIVLFFFANNGYDSTLKKYIGKSGYKFNSQGTGWIEKEIDININEDSIET